MALYLKVIAIATIKIQDPYDDKTIEQAKENTYISTPFELVKEDYRFETEDAN